MPRVLVVEDEAAIARLVAMNLRHAGFEAVLAADADAAQREISGELPDLVLLDWMLLFQSGLQLAQRWRADARTRGLPIIMLTARAAEDDRTRGLGASAGDCLSKPFLSRELLARRCAVLRRRAPEALDAAVEVSGLRLDPATHHATHRVTCRADGASSEPREAKMGPTVRGAGYRLTLQPGGATA